MTPIVVVALGILAALWGSAFPMIKVGLDGLSAPHLTLMRHMVASLAFVPLLLAFRARLRPALADVPYFFLLGTLGLFVYHLALNYGEMRVSAGAASLIIASAPAITALLAYFMVGDRMPRLGWIGSLVAFGGVGLIVLGNGGADAGPGLNAFAWLIVLSAVVTSFFAILQRRMFARYRPIEVAAFATWAGTVPMLAFLPGLPADAADAGAAEEDRGHGRREEHDGGVVDVRRHAEGGLVGGLLALLPALVETAHERDGADDDEQGDEDDSESDEGDLEPEVVVHGARLTGLTWG